MSPEVIGIGIGLAFTIPTVYYFRRIKIEDRAWPIFLITLPGFYMLFGLFALDGQAIWLEFLYGIPYILLGALVWKIRNQMTVLVLGAAWFSHGFYDYYHDLLFINPGVFSWYPSFCAVVDIIVGLYLMAQSHRIVNQP